MTCLGVHVWSVTGEVWNLSYGWFRGYGAEEWYGHIYVLERKLATE